MPGVHPARGALLLCALVSVLATQLTGPLEGIAYQLANQLVALGCTVLAGVGAWRHRSSLGWIGVLIFLGMAVQWIGSTGQSIDALFVHSGAFPAWTDAPARRAQAGRRRRADVHRRRPHGRTAMS